MIQLDNRQLIHEDQQIMIGDESLLFPTAPISWKVLIVDADIEVHTVTKTVLESFTFDGKVIDFFSAYSASEGKKILLKNRDIAVILLDVLLSSECSGLQLAHYIRTKLSNNLVRIILRTDQPGQAPNQNIVVDYDISDYKGKVELTTQKLSTTLVTALRSFRDMSLIEVNRQRLKKITDFSHSLFELQSMSTFAADVLSQLANLLQFNPNSLSCHASSLAATKINLHDFQVLAANGNYESLLGKTVTHDFSLKAWNDIMTALGQKQSIYFHDCFVLYFCSKQGLENIIYQDGINTLSIWDQDLVEIFSNHVAVAFDYIYLNQEVEDTQKEILFTLGEVAEARSQETGDHVKRVAEIAELLALRSGLSLEIAESLRLATPIHDVGKLAIPDAILNKPGKLTPEEFSLMKTHSPIGYDMLKNSKRSILKLGALIALQHHERYDGTGYPYGLVGEEIHIYGRIVALADVFDALSSVRVYKKTWPLEKILDYIRDQRGAHFDPRLVDIFMENIDDIMQIYKRLAKV